MRKGFWNRYSPIIILEKLTSELEREIPFLYYKLRNLEMEAHTLIICDDTTNPELMDVAREQGWVEPDAVYMTSADAAIIYDLPEYDSQKGSAFKSVRHFGEFKYFSVTEIPEKSFNGCFSLVNISLPESIRGIDLDAFRGCSALTWIELNEGLVTIREGAFASCVRLAELTIPSSVRTITGAFKNCSGLKKIICKVPNPLNFLYNELFSVNSYCKIYFDRLNASYLKSMWGHYRDRTYSYNGPYWNLSNINPLRSITNFLNRVYGERLDIIENRLRKLEESRGVLVIGSIASNAPLMNIAIQYGWVDKNALFMTRYDAENVETLPPYTNCSAFHDVKNFEVFRYFNGITEIPDNTFREVRLETIELPDSITRIGDYAFYKCFSLRGFSNFVGNNIEYIGNYAFGGCSSVINYKLPSCIKYIGDFAFYRVTFGSLIIYATTPPSLGKSVFYESNLKIYVPRQSIGAYISNEYWKPYINNIYPLNL